MRIKKSKFLDRKMFNVFQWAFRAFTFPSGIVATSSIRLTYICIRDGLPFWLPLQLSILGFGMFLLSVYGGFVLNYKGDDVNQAIEELRKDVAFLKREIEELKSQM